MIYVTIKAVKMAYLRQQDKNNYSMTTNRKYILKSIFSKCKKKPLSNAPVCTL